MVLNYIHVIHHLLQVLLYRCFVCIVFLLVWFYRPCTHLLDQKWSLSKKTQFQQDTIPTVLPVNSLFNFCRSRTARPSLNENLSKRISDGVKAVEPELFIAKSIVCNPSAKYRTIDGTCNNLYRTNMGAAGTPQSRFVPPEYGDSK